MSIARMYAQVAFAQVTSDLNKTRLAQDLRAKDASGKHMDAAENAVAKQERADDAKGLFSRKKKKKRDANNAKGEEQKMLLNKNAEIGQTDGILQLKETLAARGSHLFATNNQFEEYV